jgi:hypothetical protein
MPSLDTTPHELIQKLRSWFFSRDRDITMQTDRKIILGDGSTVVDLTGEPFVTTGTSTKLTNESVITEGHGIDIVSGGGTTTVAADETEFDQGLLGTDASFVTMALHASLPNERKLTDSTTILWTDGGPNGNVTGAVDSAALDESQFDHGLLAGLIDDDHTQYIRKDTLTIKGDIVGSTAASTPAAVSVTGNDGRVLTEDSTAATGMSWQDPATGGNIPIGGIILWSGSIVSIPANWALCDGLSSTPDLRGRFVIGAGGTYAVDATGGSETANLAHTHGVGTFATSSEGHTHGSGTLSTNSQGAHTHAVGTLANSSEGHTHGSGTLSTDNPGTHTHGAGSYGADSGGAHTHSISGSSASAGSHLHNPGTLIGETPGPHSHTAGTLGTGTSSDSHVDTVDPSGFDVSRATHTHAITGSPGSGGGHAHTIAGQTDSQGSHSHGNDTYAANSGGGHTHGVSGTSGGGGGHTHSVNTGSTASDSHSHTISGATASNGAHTHSVDTGSTASDSHSHTISGATATGGSATQDIMPPYYALAYIMRTS